MSHFPDTFGIVANANSNRDNALCLQFWRDQRCDFHQTDVSPLLEKFWSSLNLKHGSRVFVPLCGKSLDLIWLARQGH
jgi:thiopurine S-methyltransferase